MRGHRIAPPAPGTLAAHAQRRVLLELVVDPPVAGDEVAALPRRLGLSEHAIDGAVLALTRAGLARRRGDRVAASRAALYFEALWPTGL